MKKSLNFLAFVILICTVSYTSAIQPKDISEEQIKSLTKKELKLLLRMQKPDTRIGIDEAKKISDEHAALLNEKINYKDGKKVASKNEDVFGKYGLSKEIKSVSGLLSSDIKNSDMKDGKYKGVAIPDTLAYILDFKNGTGFSIISADRRIDYSVLAFARQGSFDRKTDNPGMALYLEMLEDYLLNSVAEAELQKDSLLNSILKKIGVDNIAGINLPSKANPTWVVETKIGPLISVKWGQNMPFNGSLDQVCSLKTYRDTISGYWNTNDRRYVTGCVNTALIQIQSYWEHPIIHPYSGTSWAILKSYRQFHNFNDSAYLSQAERDRRATARLIVGNLFKQLGGMSLNMNYGCNVSTTEAQKAIDYFGRNGYAVSALGSFNANTVVTSISNGRPVWVNGCAGGSIGNIIIQNVNCHSWVIDGIITKKEMVSIGGVNIEVSVEHRIYNNWGWDGLEDIDAPIGVFKYYPYLIEIATIYR